MVNMTIEQDMIRPPQPPGPIKWIKENLFSSILNTVLTILLIPVISYLLYGVFRWMFFAADWTAVTQFPLLYAVGQYPRDQLWRVGIILSGLFLFLGMSWGRWGGLLKSISLAAGLIQLIIALLPVQHPALDMSMRLFLGSGLLVILLGYLIGSRTPIKNTYIIIGWFIVPIFGIVLLAGFEVSKYIPIWISDVLLAGFEVSKYIPIWISDLIPSVSTTLWGGLLITFLLAAGGILLSFPLGIALAFGRRSSLPFISPLCECFLNSFYRNHPGSTPGDDPIYVFFRNGFILASGVPDRPPGKGADGCDSF